MSQKLLAATGNSQQQQQHTKSATQQQQSQQQAQQQAQQLAPLHHQRSVLTQQLGSQHTQHASLSAHYGYGNADGNTKRIRRSEVLLKQAADCVSRGQTFQTVSDQFNIPISTIRYVLFFQYSFIV